MCTACKGETFSGIKQRHGVMRPGKTERDRHNQCAERSLANRDARMAWQHDVPVFNSNFPLTMCNGKRSRSLKPKETVR